MKKKIKGDLDCIKNISITVDIWSDRTMRGFMGVTGHYFHQSNLKSLLLSCDRFTGELYVQCLSCVTGKHMWNGY